ncbi:MAG: hypothetical protein C5B45_04645 [Chlamydiae bacterium]|nr:MAG: hypothetical protein C5B45_04645 [Chlamydiota bacterium]
MSIQFIRQSLFFNAPPKHTALAFLTQPYVLSYAYLTRVIYPCEGRPNLSLYEKSVYILIGTSLFIPILNTIIYVALRILCSNHQTTEIDQTSLASNSPKFDKALYNQKIEKIRSKAHTATQKITDAAIRQDIQDFINEIHKTAQQLIETSANIDLCSSITENVQRELFCIEEQTQYLVDTQEEESISISLQPIVISENALHWSREISRAMRANDKSQFTILLEEGKKSHFINLKFRHFLNGTLFHHFSKMDRVEYYLILLISTGIDPSLQDNWGNTGLIWAIANACNTNALLILQNLRPGPYLDIQCLLHQNTALHLAIAKGYKDRSKHGQQLEVSNLKLIETLLQLKANPNLQTKEGYTPLHLACVRRDYAMISALVKAGADPYIKDNKGQVPEDLLILGYSGALEILKKIGNVCLLNEEEYEDKVNLANIIQDLYKNYTSELTGKL